MSALDTLKGNSRDHTASVEGRFLSIRPRDHSGAALAAFQRLVGIAHHHDGFDYTILVERRASQGHRAVCFVLIELDSDP